MLAKVKVIHKTKNCRYCRTLPHLRWDSRAMVLEGLVVRLMQGAGTGYLICAPTYR